MPPPGPAPCGVIPCVSSTEGKLELPALRVAGDLSACTWAEVLVTNRNVHVRLQLGASQESVVRIPFGVAPPRPGIRDTGSYALSVAVSDGTVAAGLADLFAELIRLRPAQHAESFHTSWLCDEGRDLLRMRVTPRTRVVRWRDIGGQRIHECEAGLEALQCHAQAVVTIAVRGLWRDRETERWGVSLEATTIAVVEDAHREGFSRHMAAAVHERAVQHDFFSVLPPLEKKRARGVTHDGNEHHTARKRTAGAWRTGSV